MATISIRKSARAIRILGVPVALVLAFQSTAGPVRGQLPLTIVPTYDSSITSDANAATIIATINQAINQYNTTLTTATAAPVTVHITFQEMGSGLGQSSSVIFSIPYASVRTALLSHALSANDATANATLPVQANSPADNQANMWVSSANGRALGLATNAATDSTVGLNTSIMNLTRPPGNPSFYDLKAVAQHEIDEALGMGSGLNLPSGFPRQSQPQDLFRYSAPGTRSYTTATTTSYFSLDGGTTNLVDFHQTADGADFGDWLGGATARVQDAFGTPGATPDLGVELTNLDVIGYNLAPVPEPASFLLTGAGLAAAAFVRRRRKAVAA